MAFYYGANPPWDALRTFDVAVVEPEHAGPAPSAVPGGAAFFAYLSVGEIEYARPYANALPAGLVKGANEPWKSHVVDQTHPEWPKFFVERIVAPLWEAGYRGFFLDTLDSFQLIATTDDERAQQARGLSNAIRALRAQYPQAKLIFNRGFEVLPELHAEAWAVAAESIYRGWDQKNRRYTEVAQKDRDWLLRELERVRSEYGLPVIAIEYAPPGDRALARETARRIAALGFVPWVANAELDQLGVGNIEWTPRRVLLLHDGEGRDAHLYARRIQEQARKPFAALGYEVDYADVSKPLPAYPLVGRYAGIVTWFTDDQAVSRPGVREWLTRQRGHGMRMAVLGSFPFPLSDSLAATFGLSAGAPRAPGSVRVSVRDPLIRAEAEAGIHGTLFTPLRANQAVTPLLRLRTERGDVMDAAALMPWGGYVLQPYESAPAVDAAGDRWLIEPVLFMQRALALPAQGFAARAADAGRAPAGPGAGAIPHPSVCRAAGGGSSPIGVNQGAMRYGLKHNASERLSITCAS